jgi:hypothetical protein
MPEIFKPVLRVPVLEDWLAKESHTVLAPSGQANVIASSEPLDPDVDVHQYADAQGSLLRTEFARYVEQEFRPELVFGGRPGYLRRFSWTPPDGVPVTQIQVYYAENGRGYTATATTPTSSFEEYGDQLRQILGDMFIEAPRERD